MIGTLIAAWLDVRTKPLRTFAAIAGMVAAVVAVVLVNAAGILSHAANDMYLARQYGMPVTISISAVTGNPTMEMRREMELLLESNGIHAYSLDVNFPVTVVHEQDIVWSGIRWLDPEFKDVRIVDMVVGAWPDETASSDTYHVVIEEGFAPSVLGISDREIVGQTLGYADAPDGGWDGRITPQIPLVVDGVVSTQTNAFGSGMAPIAIVSRQEPMTVPGFPLTPTWLARVHPSDFGLVQQLASSVIDSTGREVFQVRRADQADTLAPVLSQQDVTAQAVSVVALIIGGLGIFGVGLAGVRERSKEFGLRRALGASTIRIFLGVIVQTLIEVIMAAAIAVFLSAILVEMFARDLVLETLPMPSDTSLPLSSAVLGVTGALVVGLVAGLIPAITAARLSVVQALRG